MGAPIVRGPRDVPELREWLHDQWRPGRPYAVAAAGMLAERSIGNGVHRPRSAEAYRSWEERAIASASLWWIGEEMVDLLLAVAPTLPDELVWADLDPPAPSGLVVLAKPWLGMDSDDPERTVTTDAFVWSGAHLPPDIPGRRPDAPLHAVSVACYQRVNFDDGLNGRDLQTAVTTGATMTAQATPAASKEHERAWTLHGEAWLPLGRSDWPIGDKLCEAPWPMEDSRLASAVEDRRVLAALFVLLRTDAVVARVTQRGERAQRRRAERARLAPPDVQVVALRRPKTEGDEHEPTEHDVHWSCRWIVQPHVRLQPYGPGRTLRRAILVGPYVKGPADKPLKVPTRVNAWVR